MDLVELSGGSYEAPAMQGQTRDGRTLAGMLAGSAAQLTAVVSGAESTAQIVALRMRVRRMEAELREASHASTADDSQHSPD
mgnify:CR=1 FL=1